MASRHAITTLGTRHAPPACTAAIVALLTFTVAACGPEVPPQATTATSAAVAPPPFRPGEHAAVLTYAGERGAFADASEVDAIPEDRRGFVRVHLLEGPTAPAGKVWVANLRQADADAGHALRAMSVDEFELFALGDGAKSTFVLPPGLELPDVVPASETLIVYKTSWCGVCKKLTAWLDSKGIAYQAKDIETDPAAAAELAAKAKQKGIPLGSVPVVDVRGELMVGFDRARLEKMLAS